jgi:hypothetical protein
LSDNGRVVKHLIHEDEDEDGAHLLQQSNPRTQFFAPAQPESEPMTAANTDKATFEAAEAEVARQIREGADATPEPEPKVDKDGFIRPINPAKKLVESDEITNPRPVTISYINDDGWFGCVSTDTFHEIVQFAIQKDQEAYIKALAQHILIGDCVELPKYLHVIKTADAAVFSGLV